MPNKNNPQWSRPQSAATAGNTIKALPSPKKIKGPKLLIVGGSPSFIPGWISDTLSFKHFNYSAKSFYTAIGNFEADAILLFVKSTDGHTKRQVFDYGRKHNIPVLVMYKGWSHLIEDAKEKGVTWLVSHYPYDTYISEEDKSERQEKRNAKSRKKKPKTGVYDKRRKKAFSEAGIVDEYSKHATTRYVSPMKTHCVLCNTKIKYQYGLDFAIPGEENIISFFPVGSSCIRSWISSLPNSDYLVRIKKQAERELEKPTGPVQLDFGWG